MNLWLSLGGKHEGLHILKHGSIEVIDKIKIKGMSSFPYIAAFNNKLYYSNNSHHSVTCKTVLLFQVESKKLKKNNQQIFLLIKPNM